MLTNNKQQTTNNKQQTTNNKQTSYVNGEKCLKSKDSVFDVSNIF